MNAAQLYDNAGARILIVDDHGAVRAGLRNLISTRSGWVVCGEAADGDEAVEKALELNPSAIVMDISMPRMNGLEATRRIRERIPGAEILIVSQHDSDHVVLEAQRAGARGFVVKSHLSADLLPALEAALLHSSRISAPVSKAWQDAIAGAKKLEHAHFEDPGPHDDLDLMSGGGVVGELMRAQNWARTAFGPVSEWPQSLRTALRICLDSRFPIVIFWGPEFRHLYNDSYLSVLGSKHPEALGETGKKIWAEIWDTIGPMLEGVMRTGQATWERDQLLLIKRSGYLEEGYFTYSYSAIRLSSGEVGGIFCAVHEVTDRVLGARRLKTLREVADQVVQAKNETDACRLAMQSVVRNPTDCPFAMIFLVEDGKARRVAASFDAEAIVPSILDLAEEDAWRVKYATQTRSAQVFAIADSESLPVAPYGNCCEAAISIPIVGPSRETIAVLTVGLSPYRALDEAYREFLESLARNLAANIVNAKAYDEERKRAQALADLDRAKTAFFSNVSHEFRTPLTLMLGPLEDALASGDRVPPQEREKLEIAHRNALRLLKLVNTLLDFSRIEAGRIQASYEPTDLSALTAELASVFRSAIERAGLKLVVNCEPLAEPVYVDREMWEKIVLNLLSNAFKFTFAGEIEVSLKAAEATVELAVRDTGTGIPGQDLPHLFERFYRVKGTQGRTFEGSGIGLALVQELAKLHGGTVAVESTLKQGSTFTVTVPLGKEHLPADRIGASRTQESTGLGGEVYVEELLHWSNPKAGAHTVGSPNPDTGEPAENRGRPRILLADDNADMRDYVRSLLMEEFEVAAVGDGESALKLAQEQRPDLILSDVMMPRLDGFGLLEAVRRDANLKSVPVILLSARAGEEARIEGLQAGADDYLIKPFSARELLARIKSHLAMAKVRAQGSELQRVLQANTELMAAIVASSNDAIISKDLNGVITSWNETAQRIFGYRAHEAIGKPIMLIIPPERREEEVGILKRLRRGERIEHFETERVRKDGTRVTVSLTISPVRDASGKVIGASKVARDITEQKHAERALRESEEWQRSILETTPECVKLVAADGTLLQMNGPGLSMIGARAEAVIGTSIYDVIAPEHRELFRAFNERVCSGERGALEFDLIDTQGNRRHMETHAAPLPHKDGSLVHLAVTRDVTERRMAEETLRNNRARFEYIAEAADVGYWFCDLPFDTLQWDRRVKEHFWLPPDAEVTLDTFYERLHPEDREPTRKAIEESIANNTRYDVEYRTISEDGREKWIRAVGGTAYDSFGQPKRFDGLTTDITARKLAEEGYRKLTQTLEMQVQARTEELEERTADVLRQSEQLRDLSWQLLRTQDEERRHVARELHDSAGQTLAVLGMELTQHIEKLRDRSPEMTQSAEEIEKIVGQLQSEIRTTSYLLHPPLLDEVGLEAALHWFVDGLGARIGLDVKLSIPQGFGRLPRALELVIFRLVQECLTNIHRHSGSKTAEIQIRREQNQVFVEVRDQGRGIPPEKVAKIQAQGSGVGIRGMRERVLQFGGSLQIHSSSTGTVISTVLRIPETPRSQSEPETLRMAI